MARKTASQAMLVRARQQQVLALYAKGQTPDQIAIQLKMRIQEVNQDIAQATDRLLAHYTCPPQHTFVRYAVFNLGIISKLQRAVERFERDKKTVQYNSVISALRAQSDVYDKILDKGLDFGVIERKRASKAVTSPKDIQQLLKGEILTLSRLLDEVDLSVRFKATRRSLMLREQQQHIRASRTYTPILIKPLIGPYGVIKCLPDWKYPRKLYKQGSGSHAPQLAQRDASPEQLDRLHTARDIQRLSQQLDEEKQKTRQLTQQLKHEHTQLPPGQEHTPPSPPGTAGWLVPPSTPPR